MLRIGKLLIGGVAFLGLGIATSQASTISLFNTGVDNTGMPLANGATDQHWLLNPTGENTETAANTMPTAATSAHGFPIGPWLGDDASSDWIGPNAALLGPNAPDGTVGFIYSEAFTTPSSGTVTIAVNVGADNSVRDIQIDNGPLQAASNPDGFGTLDANSITQAVIGSSHTIKFYVQNGVGEGAGDGYTGFRAEFTSATYVPEPASIGLLGLVGAGLVARRRRA